MCLNFLKGQSYLSLVLLGGDSPLYISKAKGNVVLCEVLGPPVHILLMCQVLYLVNITWNGIILALVLCWHWCCCGTGGTGVCCGTGVCSGTGGTDVCFGETDIIWMDQGLRKSNALNEL